MSNQKPYINQSFFSKPPPNFNKHSSSQWNNFKVPTSPIVINNSKNTNSNNSSTNYPTNSQSTSRNYTSHSNTHSNSPKQTRNYFNLQNNQSGSQTQTGSINYTTSSQSAARNYQTTPLPNVRNFKNEPPPNFNFQSADVSPLNQYKNSVFNPVGLIPGQQFKPNVPPPKIQESTQNSLYEMNLKANSGALQAQMVSAATLEEAKANYYMQMLYRYRQVADYSQSLLAYSTAPVQPPPPNYPPPQQPPLPPDAPPQKPPLPPTPALSMQSDSSIRSPFSPGSSSIPMSKQQLQMQHQRPMGNYHPRAPQQFNVYNPQFNKPMHYNLKRKYEGNTVEQKKIPKKKKKPLSQVVPQKITWSMEAAKKALDVERECNKRTKRQGLVIKFPDQELNRDIVTTFHTSIESVHFQQPSTPRYCFVTLMDSADPETVIRHINKIPFGLGYLCAEYKKDREDDQNIRPCDIDPLTLYVGNLAQEITKDDMTKTYPKQKRIDIGYAKKMKYTRYAFVSFHTVDDAIEAFKKTHSSQMYSKSLIVRFRRLCGTVGLPGETRVQIPPRNTPENGAIDTVSNNDNPWDINVSQWYNEDAITRTLETRPLSEDEDDEEKTQPYVPPDDFRTRLEVDHFDELIERFDASYTCVPGNVTIKEEIYDKCTETNGYQDIDYGYGEGQDQHPNVSNPRTPQIPGFPNHYDESKQEQLKEEDCGPHSDSIRYRVIQDTIDIRHPDTTSQDPITPLVTERPLNDAVNSTDSDLNVKQEEDDEIDSTARKIGAQRVSNIEIMEPISFILPTPIMIKKESDDINAGIDTEAELPSGNGTSNNSLNVRNDSSAAAFIDHPDSSAEESSDGPPIRGLEQSSERCHGGAENSDLDDGASYPIRDIKHELELDDPAGNDNSSDELCTKTKVSNPRTPQIPGFSNHYDESKQEQLKEEDCGPHSDSIRFRVLPDTIDIRHPDSTSQDPITPLGTERPLTAAVNSTDGDLNVKQEEDDEIDSTAQKIGAQRVSNIEIQNMEPISFILPTPIVIKKESDDINDDIDTEAELPSGNGTLKNSLNVRNDSSADASKDHPDSSAEESSDGPPMRGLEQSSERCDAGAENFDWDVGASYRIRDINHQLELDDPAGDDNSSDEELNIRDILKKQKKTTKEKGD